MLAPLAGTLALMGIEFLSCPWTRTAPRSESAWTLATPPRVWRCTPIARVTRPLTQFTGVPFAVLAAALTALHLTAWRTAFGFSERWEMASRLAHGVYATPRPQHVLRFGRVLDAL